MWQVSGNRFLVAQVPGRKMAQVDLQLRLSGNICYGTSILQTSQIEWLSTACEAAINGREPSPSLFVANRPRIRRVFAAIAILLSLTTSVNSRTFRRRCR